MDQQISLEAITPKYSQKAQTILAKIDQKAEQLKTRGIESKDLEKLKKRLHFTWGAEKAPAVEISDVHKWRNRTARDTYSQLHDTNCHLLLPVMLAVSPTDCSDPAFKEILWFLFNDQKYTTYRLSLGPVGNKSLESIAIECGFIDSSRYLTFMQSLFPPQGQEQPRHIKFIYSQVPLDRLESFLLSLIPGVVSSQKAAAERRNGLKKSDCATVMIPVELSDCICHFVSNRDVVMKSIHKYGASSLTTE